MTYSKVWDSVLEENKRLRYLGLCAMDADMMIRCIGRVDYPALREFLIKVRELIRKAEKVRITTPAGGDVTFENDPSHPITLELSYADVPGPHFLPGQIGWLPKLNTVNGLTIFDGSLWPPLGVLNEPVKLQVKKDRIEGIEGGKEALEFEAWLKGFRDPNMFMVAHVCFVFLPSAKLSGITIEDERVWGCTVWGIGNVGAFLLPPKGRSAKSHTDGICLNSSVWLDDSKLLDRGNVVHPELVDLAKTLGKS